jgi:hypothetical protein
LGAQSRLLQFEYLGDALKAGFLEFRGMTFFGRFEIRGTVALPGCMGSTAGTSLQSLMREAKSGCRVPDSLTLGVA